MTNYNWPLRTDLGRLFFFIFVGCIAIFLTGLWLDRELAVLGFGGMLSMIPVVVVTGNILRKHNL